MAAIQGIYIRRHEERSTPKPHVVYLIEVQTSVRSWEVPRRYSEFVDLHDQLSEKTGAEPPVRLPSKHIFSFRKNDEAILKERQAGLEQYLRGILSSKNGVWRDCTIFNEFLEIPSAKHVTRHLESQFTLLSWLDEHAELQDLVRNTRADIYKRNSLSDMGDVTAAHTSNVQAKRRLVTLLDRIGALAVALEALREQGIPQGELQRRSDMVARLQDDCEKLAKMLLAARRTPHRSGKAAEESNPASNRASLLSSQQSRKDGRPVTRVFGAVPQETDQTRPLDDHGLFELQKTQMEQQDEQLSQLTAILRRQRQLGVAISTEIEQQNELLDHLSQNVDSTDRKLDTASQALRRL